MKINHRFVTGILALALLIALTFLGISHLNRKDTLKSQKELIAQLQEELASQHTLLRTDSLLVQGKYQDALATYRAQNTGEINDNSFGVGLRMAIAEKFLAFEEDLAQQRAMLADSTSEVVTDLIEDSPEKIDQLDSLNFVLSKTKMQLLKLRRQLHEKSFGEYLTFTNAKGSQVHYVGKVQQGKANGHGIAILNTGSRYVGQWQNNERHGHGIFYWKDGEYYEGDYVNDKRNGQGTYYWPNGEKYVGQWKDDQRSGKGAFFDKDGNILTQGVWENDKMITAASKSKRQRSKDKDMASL